VNFAYHAIAVSANPASNKVDPVNAVETTDALSKQFSLSLMAHKYPVSATWSLSDLII
jgi:hypothetical protein